MPPLAAAPLEHRFAFAKFGAYRLKPAQQFIAILFILMREFLPRPTKIFSRRLLSGSDLRQIREARNAPTNGEDSRTSRALQLARKDFNPILFCDRFQINRASAQ